MHTLVSIVQQYGFGNTGAKTEDRDPIGLQDLFIVEVFKSQFSLVYAQSQFPPSRNFASYCLWSYLR